MEYIAAALEARGHRVDARRSPLQPIARVADARAARPSLVGIAAMHALETDEVVALARRVRALSPDVPIVIGGHTAAAYPDPFLVADVSAVVLDDGERALPRVCDALDRGAPLTTVPGLALPDGDGGILRTAGETGTLALDEVPLPARHHVAPWRRQYACLAHRPTWLVETARGCPFRCSFCSIWQLHARSVRERSIDAVCRDFASVGDHVFVADDLFWHHPSRSLELAHELRRRGVRKQWILVQSRVDLVARHPELLEAWRPIARDFDIFFGLEAATDEGLDGLTKDATVDETARGHRRRASTSATASPATSSSIRRGAKRDFERLWAFVERHQLFQAGFTILTPLPGTAYFDEMRRHAARAALVALRHASPALGAGARAGALLRAVLRDVAPVGAQPEGAQAAVAVAARGRPAQRAVPDAGAPAHAAHDGPGALPRRIRPGAVGRAAPRASSARAATAVACRLSGLAYERRLSGRHGC